MRCGVSGELRGSDRRRDGGGESFRGNPCSRASEPRRELFSGRPRGMSPRRRCWSGGAVWRRRLASVWRTGLGGGRLAHGVGEREEDGEGEHGDGGHADAAGMAGAAAGADVVEELDGMVALAASRGFLPAGPGPVNKEVLIVTTHCDPPFLASNNRRSRGRGGWSAQSKPYAEKQGRANRASPRRKSPGNEGEVENPRTSCASSPAEGSRGVVETGSREKCRHREERPRARRLALGGAVRRRLPDAAWELGLDNSGGRSKL